MFLKDKIGVIGEREFKETKQFDHHDDEKSHYQQTNLTVTNIEVNQPMPGQLDKASVTMHFFIKEVF